MNVLSLFDGMSCGQQALERVGIKVDNYFASEIDKYAIKVTMANYPNTIKLGSVTKVDGYKLPKIDLLIGGSPCQSFSFAGKRKGMSAKDEQEILTLEHYLQLKEEGFEFEGQSYLFWEYMRLLNEVKPTYFLLENVEMGEKWEKVLSKAIGVNGIHINSALVSAQNRKRIYWTNIGMKPAGLFNDLESFIQQPKDKGILLKDILENDVDYKYFLKNTSFIFDRIKNNHPFIPRIPNENEKSNCLKIGGSGVDDLIKLNDDVKGGDFRYDEGFRWRDNGKSGTLTAQAREDGTGGQALAKIKTIEIIQNVKTRKHKVNIDGLKKILNNNKKLTIKEISEKLNVKKTKVEHWFRLDDSFAIPDSEYWHQLKQLLCINTNEFDEQICEFVTKENTFEKSNRVYDINGISPTLTAASANEKIIINSNIRRLTPIECERLQTVKDNYTNYVSDSQRYKMLGNGWTVDVIAHIFKYLK